MPDAIIAPAAPLRTSPEPGTEREGEPSLIIVIFFPLEHTTVSIPFSRTVPAICNMEEAASILAILTSSGVIPSNRAASPL